MSKLIHGSQLRQGYERREASGEEQGEDPDEARAKPGAARRECWALPGRPIN